MEHEGFDRRQVTRVDPLVLRKKKWEENPILLIKLDDMPLSDPIVNMLFNISWCSVINFWIMSKALFIVIGNNAHIVGTEQKPRDSTIT